VKRRSPRTIVLIGGPEVSPDNPFVLGQGGFDVAAIGTRGGPEDLFCRYGGLPGTVRSGSSHSAVVCPLRRRIAGSRTRRSRTRAVWARMTARASSAASPLFLLIGVHPNRGPCEINSIPTTLHGDHLRACDARRGHWRRRPVWRSCWWTPGRPTDVPISARRARIRGSIFVDGSAGHSLQLRRVALSPSFEVPMLRTENANSTTEHALFIRLFLTGGGGW
jgi:hypothetical protein